MILGNTWSYFFVGIPLAIAPVAILGLNTVHSVLRKQRHSFYTLTDRSVIILEGSKVEKYDLERLYNLRCFMYNGVGDLTWSKYAQWDAASKEDAANFRSDDHDPRPYDTFVTLFALEDAKVVKSHVELTVQRLNGLTGQIENKDGFRLKN